MQTLSWYVHRLGRMSAAELAYRVAQAARATQDRLANSHEAPVPRPESPRANAPFVHTPPTVDRAPYILQAENFLIGRFAIFDLEAAELGCPPDWNRDPLTKLRAPLQPAGGLDYRDERLVGNIKYLWEPNRHLHIASFAQAYALTGEGRYGEAIQVHIDSWIEQCPPGRGPNWCSSLELAIRLINWSIAWQLLGGYSAAMFNDAEGRAFRDRWQESVYRQARGIMRKLSRFSSANNHLIGEAAGVYIASVTWTGWPQLREWGRQCKRILMEEALKQSGEDGGNREQAFSYQQFVLDFLLLAGLAARGARDDFSKEYWLRIEHMIEFIASMMDVSGHVPMIGDADDGYVVKLEPEIGEWAWSKRHESLGGARIAAAGGLKSDNYRSLIATGALLFDRRDFARKAGCLDDKSAWLFGGRAQERFDSLLARAPLRYTGTRAFPVAGYYLLGDRYETRDEVRMVIDAGPLGYLSIAAHGHADALSFVLSVAGEEVLIDPGTYAYHTSAQWRRYFRGTRAHNTVLVDACDQSDQSGNFMWSRHANARCLEFVDELPVQRFVAEHDGYGVLRDPLTHRREIEYDAQQRKFTITDTLECKGPHTVRLHWHCTEQLQPIVTDNEVCLFTDRHRVRLIAQRAPDRVLTFRGGSAEEGGWVSRGFGRKTPTTTVAWESAIHGTTVIRTYICVEEEEKAIGDRR
jgi:Heparinase II/III-like protein/Heparinase II/III N-terminus